MMFINTISTYRCIIYEPKFCEYVRSNVLLDIQIFKNNLFITDENISLVEMFAMLCNFAKFNLSHIKPLV